VSDRPDRLETGVYRMPPREDAARPRRAPVTFSGGDVPSDTEVVVGFDLKGLPTDDADSFAAKRVEAERGTRHYVKFSTSGSDIGRMLNPFGLYFSQNVLRHDEAKTGRPRYEFKRVPEPAFREYVRFLQTRVESHLRNAERMVLDA
jgi:hypothetical protein